VQSYLDIVIPRYHTSATPARYYSTGGHMSKTLTLRLEEEQARELEAVARVDDVPISGAIRDAISAHIVARREDHEFQERLARTMEEDREILEKLAER
jgi:predicted transcriptional regulator